ncbi:hypothetical protein PHJA_001676400 [Phtheirospermum japonicum]|uniref:FYR C-terminal domain-containing protein n=1 Tax=Phtheirospermum japonicum TaxID=374723 RepID=A0A830CLM6_9LAMI|nr:hypothetical protein PHJA_001676400 [Phtheirospermum japonicum]
MGKKIAKEAKSDGIEILSIGKLYSGPWDKKYWSSSRGKDRYPYPVGYKSLRTQNGVTYTMEIFEGLKGPSFTISSSTDVKTCSGDTPDIAWDSFQKKSFSKLWHGKRFSSKIDGVEFFGFKNTFVQRLLRELVSNVGGTAEQSSSQSNLSSEVCETVNQSQSKPSSPDPNLLTYLVKSHVKGKRSKVEKAVNNKGLDGTNFEQCQQEKCIENASSSNSKKRNQLSCGHDPSTPAGTNEASESIENEKCPPIAERDMQMDTVGISDHLRVRDSLSDEERELTSSTNHFESDIGNLLQNHKSGDRSKYVNDADLFAPDTLDHTGDGSAIFSSPKKDVQMHDIVNDAIVKDVAKYAALVTDSFPEAHTDSVGQEIAKSMMTFLLPRAVPLLKTFTRKKKKTEKPSNLSTHRSQEENNIPNISLNGAATVSGLADYSDVGNKVCTASIGHDSVNSNPGNSDSVVPDSFDNSDPQHIKEVTPNSKKRARFSCLPKSEASFAKLHKDTDLGGSDNSSSKLQIPSTSGCCSLTVNNETNDDSRTNVRQNVKLSSKSGGHLELFACYVEPMPISMVQMIVKENEVFVCVICGYSDNDESTLIFYKALKNGEKIGCPSLIGQAPIACHISENKISRDIAVERSLLQLTPDAQSLVLLNSIKVPYCREGKLHCSCQACTSDCLEKNAVKILKLNKGYGSLVTRLETSQGVCCLLVCESSFLIAAEEGGKLKLWVMNSGWSGQKEECYLPTFDCMFPSIVELKTIPKFASLVVGHNGFGEFGLWDIENRNLVSKFSSPGMSVMGFVPVSVFRWQRKGECKAKALVQEIMDATRISFSGRSENHFFSPEDRDATVWLLISTVSDPESEPYQSSEQEEANRGGFWKLALLVNNTVITGRKKLGNLHSFKGSRVSCITADSSNSGALAVASEGQLLVYLPS